MSQQSYKFRSGIGLLFHAMEYLCVYLVFQLRDTAHVFNGFVLWSLGNLLGLFYQTGALFSADWDKRWGTKEELIQLFAANEQLPSPRYEVHFKSN